MAVVKKKIKSKFFDEISSGKKKSELYLNDVSLVEGDMLIIQECDEKFQLTGRQLEKKITFVQKFDINNLPWPPDDVADEGLQIINFE